MSVKLAVFDVDGTLVDSRKRIHQAAERAFTDFLTQRGAQFLPLLARLYPDGQAID